MTSTDSQLSLNIQLDSKAQNASKAGALLERENMINKTVLENGLTVITEKTKSKNIAACLSLKAGSIYESKDVLGISHFVEHLMFDENSFTIEQVGGNANGSTSDDTVSYSAMLPAEHWNVAVDFLYEIISKKDFDEKRISSEKLIVLDELVMSKESGRAPFFNDLLENVFNDSCKSEVLGTVDTIGSFAVSAINTHLNDFYQPDNMFLTLSGDVEHKDVLTYLENSFAKLKGKSNIKARIFNRKYCATDSFSEVDALRSVFALNYEGVSNRDTRRLRISQDLVKVILGIGLSSRLHKQTRDKGLGYLFQPSTISHNETGVFSVYGIVLSDMLDESIALCRELLHSMKTDISERELDRAKNYLKYTYYEKSSSAIECCLRNIENLFSFGELESEDEYISTLNSLSLEDIYAYTRKYFDGEAKVFAQKGTPEFDEAAPSEETQ